MCWRNFSPAVVPQVLVCGHSFCPDCAGVVRSCPLCRHRVATNQPRRTNYALLSLLEKLERQKELAQAAQQTQAEPAEPRAADRPVTAAAPSFFAGRSMTVAVRKTGLHLAIK